tara:strand:+ start:1304 stop:1948 length:645 start_codon:yes stop_codon:yes gene_type:complete
MDYTALGQPWQETKATSETLPRKTNSFFTYAHYPENWDLKEMTFKKGKGEVKKWIWLPYLHRIPFTAGVNGTVMNGKHLDTSVAKARLVEDGYTIISSSKYSYIKVYKGIGGKVYEEKFLNIKRLTRRKVDEKFDHTEYDKFRLQLMLDRTIEPPHPIILQDKIEDIKKIRGRLGNRVHIPEIQNKIDKLTSQIDAMTAALADVEDKGIKHYAA